MKMGDVQEVFKKAGMTNVSSVLATGNIIFQSNDSKDNLRKILEQAMSDFYKTEVHMIIKSVQEVKNIISSALFDSNSELHCYVFISEAGFANTLMTEFNQIDPVANEAASVVSDVFYWQVPKGSTLSAGFSKILNRKDLKDKITSRNINTVQKIYNKMTDPTQ